MSTYAGMDAYAGIASMPDGGVVAVGHRNGIYNPSSVDARMVRYDATGVEVWAKVYGTFSLQAFSSAHSASGGGVVAVGSDEHLAAGGRDGWAVRVDGKGAVIWEKKYGGSKYDSFSDVIERTDGSLVMAGDSQSFGKAGQAWVVRTNPAGVVTWQRTYGNADNDAFRTVISTGDGGILVAGWSQLPSKQTDALVVKLSAGGALQWKKTYTGGEAKTWEGILDIVQAPDGSFFSAGYAYDNFPNKWNKSKVKVGWGLHLSASGAVIWNKTWKNNPNQENTFRSIARLSNGELMLLGKRYKKGFDAWIVRIDAAGNTKLDKTFGGSKTQELTASFATSETGLFVAGSDWQGTLGGVVWRIDLNGNFACN